MTLRVPAILQVSRVLRPGGKFLFVEVRADLLPSFCPSSGHVARDDVLHARFYGETCIR